MQNVGFIFGKKVNTFLHRSRSLLNMANVSQEIEVIHAKCRFYFRKESKHFLTSF